MPRQLTAVDVGRAELQPVSIDALDPTALAIDLSLSAEKHGTTLPTFAGHREGSSVTYDRDLALMRSVASEPDPFPFSLGNMGVGTAAAVGADVEEFDVGERVFGYLPIGDTVVVDQAARLWTAPPGVRDEALVCVDPATVALLACRYGSARVGDRVAVIGLGSIGLLAVQLCAQSGAIDIIGIDPISERRELAEECGATSTVDPTAVDVGSVISTTYGDGGVDTTLETSGVYDALQEAVRATCYGGTIVTVSYYHGDASVLDLAQEWHFNRQELIAGARVESEPYREHPRWDRERVYETILNLFAADRLLVDELLTPVPLTEAPAAYARLADDPTDCVKLAVTYD